MIVEYRDTTRQTPDAVQDALRTQLEKRGQVEARRAEIEGLGLKLGIYQWSTQPYSTRGVKGTNFSGLYPAALPGLFDKSYPELRTDKQVLELLEQVAQADEAVTTGDTRQVLAHREATRQAKFRKGTERAQAEARAALERVP